MPQKKKEQKTKTKKVSLETSVFSKEGKTLGKITLPSEIFAAKINKNLLAQAVRVYLSNKRAGTHSTKTRGEVTGSTRKIYRQKGTGRARHGSIKAPIFIGGGVAHGPKPKDYSLSLPQKMRKLALFGALTSKFEDQLVKVVEDLDSLPIKTSELVNVLTNLNLYSKKNQKEKRTMLVLPKSLPNVYLSGRNLPLLTIREARLLNAYEVLTHRNLLFTKNALPALSETFLGKAVAKKTKKVKETKIEKKVRLKTPVKKSQ